MAGGDMEIADKDYFKVHFGLLKLLGISIRSGGNSIGSLLYRIYCLIMFIFVYFYFPIAEILYIVFNASLENATTGVTYVGSHALGTFKAAVMLISRRKITSFCDRLEAKPFSPDPTRSGAVEFRHIKDAIKASNYQVYVFCATVVAIVIPRMYVALSDSDYFTRNFGFSENTTLAKRTKTAPFNCALPFDRSDFPYFELASFYQAASAAISGFSIGVMDAVICGIMCHIKAQLLILQSCLDKFIESGIYLMDENADNQRSSREDTNLNKLNLNEVEKIPSRLQKYVDISVNNIIEHHQKILTLAEDAEETFSVLMLAQFLVSLSILCCQLFQLSVLKMGSPQFYSMIFYTLLMLFQIFIFCYRGNEVMLESYGLIDSIYESDWLVIDTKAQKSLLLMMTRACRPIKMTAGKFVFLSIEAFMAIVRGSGSYFMVLRSVNMPQE